MKKFNVFLAALLLMVSMVASAEAYQYGESYAAIRNLKIVPGSGSQVYSIFLGYHSESYALAMGPDEFASDASYSAALNSWAQASAGDAWAISGFNQGLQYSEAQAVADGNGDWSAAMGATYAGAYGLYSAKGGSLTISIDYYLSAEIGGDGYGYSEAGAGALLGVHSGTLGVNGDWLGVYGSYFDAKNFGDPEDPLSWRTLSITLDLAAGGFYHLFAGTTAYAYASAATAPVPEPATMLLLGAGMIGLAGWSRRKNFTFRKS